MTMLTVDDLARDLRVRNEDLLRELVTMGYEVEGPDSPLETDDPAALRAQLIDILPQREMVEQRIKPTVIRRRVKNPPPHKQEHPPSRSIDSTESSFHTPVHEERIEVKSQDPVKKPLKKFKKPEPARIIEPAPRPEPKPPVAESRTASSPSSAAQRSAIKGPGRNEPAAPATERPGEPAAEQYDVGAPEIEAGVPGSVEQDIKPAGADTTPDHDQQAHGDEETLQAVSIESPEASLQAGADSAAVEAPAGAPGQLRRPRVEVRPDGPRPATSQGPEARREDGPRPSEAEDTRRPLDLRNRKKRDRRMQPAQIIGRVELKPEPPKEPERPEPPRRPRPAGPEMRSDRGDSGPMDRRPGGPAPARPEAPRRPIIQEVFTPDDRKQPPKRKEKKGRDVVEDRVADSDRIGLGRRKEVVLRTDVLDDSRTRPLRLRGKGKKPKQKKTEITTPKAIKRRIKLPEFVTVGNIAHKLSVKGSEVIHHLIGLGVTATLNEPIDFDTACLVANEFGYEVESTEQNESELLPAFQADTTENVMDRPPVITVMGHVDHGKTSLLDAIRSTHVTASEAGGITQHIGAYKVKVDRGELVFLDTPGHEAFTAMRARGAQVTDFVVLVVAADDGVMDQTVEAINHARAAQVPIIVAVNKIDKPEADRDRVLRELSEHNLIPEAWGGDTLFAYVSAKTRQGIDEFLDLILLQSEVMELKANPNKKATGTIIEARLDKGKGPVATMLIREGTLRLGDSFVAGVNHGKVRAMIDYEGKSLEEAGPAVPVEVQGFSGVPEAGDLVMAVEDERIARQIVSHRMHKQRELDAAAAALPVTLENLLARMSEQPVKELNLIIKADVQGSVEAVKEALAALSTGEIKVKVIHSGVGAITESDVMLAGASNAIIIGFSVRPNPKTAQFAEQEKIDIRLYSIIYEAIDNVRKAMEGMLAPIEKETVTGRLEVRQVFSVPKIGAIAGCYVSNGKIERSSQVRLIRDNVVVYTGRINSMKRFKDDIKEALEGYECGIGLENYRDVKVGDVIEAFIIEREAAKLS